MVNLEAGQKDHKERIKRTRSLMEREGIDAIVVSDAPSYHYFTGHEMPFSPWTGYIKARPYISIVPQEGEQIILVQKPYENGARKLSFLDNIEIWDSLPFRAESLFKVLSKMGLQNRVIGWELGPGERLGFPYLEYSRLKNMLPQATFVPSLPVIQKVRSVKSNFEVNELININQKSIESFKDALVGATSNPDREIDSLGKEALYANKCHEVNYCRGGALAGAGDKWKFLTGGGMLNGYRACVSVHSLNGEPMLLQESSCELIMKQVGEVLVPGESAGSVGKRMQELIKENEFLAVEQDRLPFIGHGIGMDCFEEPIISPTSSAKIEQGNVITIKLKYKTKAGWVPLYETFVVDADGGKILRQTPKKGC